MKNYVKDNIHCWVVIQSNIYILLIISILLLSLLEAQQGQYDRKSISSLGMIWDNGELVLGFGEFLENNKELVPAGYGVDWWASDLLRQLDSDGVNDFCELAGFERSELPDNDPVSGTENCRRLWHRKLRTLELGWHEDVAVAERFGTALHGINNLWWI